MSLWRRWVSLFEDEEDASVPHYDPVHLGTVLVACLVVIGALFWLLWTLFVYEGGIFAKLAALGGGPADRFEGWTANLAALAIAACVVVLLRKADRAAARRAR